MSNYKSSGMPLWAKILLSIIGIGALFCLIVLVVGGCTGMNFVEVLQSWFTPEKLEEGTEKIEETVSMIKLIK